MSYCCFDQHSHPSTTVCPCSHRSGSWGGGIYSGPRCLSLSLVCVDRQAKGHLCAVLLFYWCTCVCVSSVIEFCVPIEALQMNTGAGLLLSNRSPEGRRVWVHVDPSCPDIFPPSSFWWEQPEGLIISATVCQLVSHWKAISLSLTTEHERLSLHVDAHSQTSNWRVFLTVQMFFTLISQMFNPDTQKWLHAKCLCVAADVLFSFICPILPLVPPSLTYRSIFLLVCTSHFSPAPTLSLIFWRRAAAC